MLDINFQIFYFSTHFWGPVFNWMIPISTISDIQREPKYISGNMTLGEPISHYF